MLSFGILVILGLTSPCFMAPLRNDDYESIFNNDFNDDFLNIFGPNNNEPELPKTNLLLTPNGIIFHSSLHLNPFDDTIKNDDPDDDTLNLNFSPDLINYPTSQHKNPFFFEKVFTFGPDVTNNDNNNDYETSDIDEIDPSTINESYLRDLINTISLLHKITDIIDNIDDDDTISTNNDDDGIININNDDSKNDDDMITFIGSSNKNPNVDIKLIFEKFDDDDDDNVDTDKNGKNDDDINKKDDSDEVKTVDIDDDIIKPEITTLKNLFENSVQDNVDDKNKKDDSDEVKTANIDDELIEQELTTVKNLLKNSIENNDYDNDDFFNKLFNNELTTLDNNNIESTTTARSTEWDESDEETGYNKNKNLKFVPYDDESGTLLPIQPVYKVIK